MNNFGEIISVGRYKKVSYYSVGINGDVSLYKQFISKHRVANKNKLYHILAWLEKIGDKVGAYEDYFRNEAKTGDARALPPKGKDREPQYIEYASDGDSGEVKPNDLRLYCMRLNEHVVLLFNGDIKTANDPEECDNVRPHFKMANKLAKLIDEALNNQEIRWISNHTDIEADDDFVLEWN
jgi:hypothetical protein